MTLELQTQQSGITPNPSPNGTSPNDAKGPFKTKTLWIYSRDQYVIQLARYFEKLKREGHCLFFVTLTYKPSHAPINDLLQQFYTNLLRHAVHPHNYHRPKYRSLQPKVFAWVDAPASKRKTNSQLPRRMATDSMHHHAVFAVNNSISMKFEGSDIALFMQKQSFIRTFDIQAIGPKDGLTEIQSLEKVIDYASYYARKHRRSQDDLTMIFPLSESERRH